MASTTDRRINEIAEIIKDQDPMIVAKAIVDLIDIIEFDLPEEFIGSELGRLVKYYKEHDKKNN